MAAGRAVIGRSRRAGQRRGDLAAAPGRLSRGDLIDGRVVALRRPGPCRAEPRRRSSGQRVAPLRATLVGAARRPTSDEFYEQDTHRTFRHRPRHLLAAVRGTARPADRLPEADRRAARRASAWNWWTPGWWTIPTKARAAASQVPARGSRLDLPLRLHLRAVVHRAAGRAEGGRAGGGAESSAGAAARLREVQRARRPRPDDRRLAGALPGVLRAGDRLRVQPRRHPLSPRHRLPAKTRTRGRRSSDWVDAAKVAAAHAPEPRRRARPLLLRHARRLQRHDPAIGRVRQSLRAARNVRAAQAARSRHEAAD